MDSKLIKYMMSTFDTNDIEIDQAYKLITINDTSIQQYDCKLRVERSEKH